MLYDLTVDLHRVCLLSRPLVLFFYSEEESKDP